MGADIGQVLLPRWPAIPRCRGERLGIDAVAAMFEERDLPFRSVADREVEAATLSDRTIRGSRSSAERRRRASGCASAASSRASIVSQHCAAPCPAANQIYISETVAVDGSLTSEMAEPPQSCSTPVWRSRIARRGASRLNAHLSLRPALCSACRRHGQVEPEAEWRPLAITAASWSGYWPTLRPRAAPPGFDR